MGCLSAGCLLKDLTKSCFHCGSCKKKKGEKEEKHLGLTTSLQMEEQPHTHSGPAGSALWGQP